MNRSQARIATGIVSVLLVSAVGCTSPLERSSEQELHDQMLLLNRQYVQATAAGSISTPIERKISTVDDEVPPERRVQLDQISGPQAYINAKEPVMGPDLTGSKEVRKVQMSLQRAIQLAVENDLEGKQSRLLPAANETQVTAADAVFDATLYTNVDWQEVDTPRPAVTANVSAAFGSQFTDTTTLATGVKKKLYDGGEVKLETGFARHYENPSVFAVSPATDAAYTTADVLVSLTQPLLRGFGSDVNRSQVMLAENARDQANHDLHGKLEQIAADAEKAYWDLVFARQRLLIAERLFELTDEDRRILKPRLGFDVKPATYTEVTARVEQRQSELIRARQNLRLTSDALKALINDPELPLAGETLIAPMDVPPDVPVSFSLLDSVTTAMRERSEVKKALSQIDDASIRQRVADNARLPQLNMNATLRYSGIGNTIGSAYDSVPDANYIDYIVGGQFEMPIGNRAAEALYQQRLLERHAAVINFQHAAQTAVQNVKDALRDVITAYELIAATRSSRRAAADSLRALNVEVQTGTSLTPEFIDLKLRREDAQAQAELDEMQALTGYSTAVAKFYQAMGTLLTRDGIVFDTTATKTE